MSFQAKVTADYLGPIAADVSDCLSIGAKCYRINSIDSPNNAEKEARKLSKKKKSKEIITGRPTFHYYLIVFEISFKKLFLKSTVLAPTLAELNIQLKNGYLAHDGAPQNESDIKSVRIKYNYGSKKENNESLSFKLGWEQKDTGPNANGTGETGEKLSNEYSVILETEASIKNCTALYQNPVSTIPKWVFERKQNEQILYDTREVWLMVEQRHDNNQPLEANAQLSAHFTVVAEKEKIIEKLTEDQIRIYRKVRLAALRTWLHKKGKKRSPSININL